MCRIDIGTIIVHTLNVRTLNVHTHKYFTHQPIADTKKGAMSRIESFEDLECWTAARDLVHLVYDLTRNASFVHDFGLKDQIRKAAVSSMSNIAEGFARFSDREFIRFLDIAQSSCEEVKSLLYVAVDQKYIDKEEFGQAFAKASDVRFLCLAFVRYLRKSSAR
ncbi:MAG: four helix bundle protein [Balneolaceae bacterium]|nr:four helix bundle protein [Balneolaceae bacterium]